MTATHTPGPWEAGNSRIFSQLHEIAEVKRPATRGNDYAASVRATDEQEANMRLIAAAPDLLEACKDVLAIWDRARLEAAIAKAEGR